MMSGRRSAPRPGLRAFARAAATVGAALLATYATDHALAQATDPAKAARLMHDLMWAAVMLAAPSNSSTKQAANGPTVTSAASC